MKPLEDAERRLAEATARLIAQAEEIGLADTVTPNKLVPPHAIRLLACAYIELLDQRVVDLHDRIDQIARVAADGAIGEIAMRQKGFTTTGIFDAARTVAFQRAQPFIEALLRSTAESSRAPSSPRLVRTPNEDATLSDATPSHKALAEDIRDLRTQLDDVRKVADPDGEHPALSLRDIVMHVGEQAALLASSNKIADKRGAERDVLKAERDVLKTEVARLTACLKEANANHEEFERKWYLATQALDDALIIIEQRLPSTTAVVSMDTAKDLLTTYCRVMRETEGAFVKYEGYIVRHWDGMDHCWTDCTAEVDRNEALRDWAERTGGGTHHVAYADIDYYRIFPGGTRMLRDGSEDEDEDR